MSKPEPAVPEGYRRVCPDWDQPGVLEEDQLRGCGSANIGWDGLEMFDCGDCGLFFLPGEGLAPL